MIYHRNYNYVIGSKHQRYTTDFAEIGEELTK